AVSSALFGQSAAVIAEICNAYPYRPRQPSAASFMSSALYERHGRSSIEQPVFTAEHVAPGTGGVGGGGGSSVSGGSSLPLRIADAVLAPSSAGAELHAATSGSAKRRKA